jgi:exosortase/archaeosortase family protein
VSAGRRRLRSWVLLGLPLAWLGVIVSARAGASAPGRWLEPVGALLASLVQLAVAWTGIDTLRQGALLYAPGAFAYEIGIGCTGLLPAAVVATAIVASPGTAGRKAWGLAIAVPLVLLVNLLRLAHLFDLGVRAPALYENAHRFWWEAALVGVVLAVWLVWSRVGEAAVTHSLRPGR